MQCLDLFLSTQTKKEYGQIKHLLTPSDAIKLPLQSFDFYTNFFQSEMEKITKQNDVKTVQKFAKQFNWKNNLELIFKKEDFEALVITNKNQEIIWVNDGFKKMTGYSKNFAKDKKPSFLQGKQTCEATRKRIRKSLQNDKPFKEIVINYREDNTPYKCLLNVFPLYNEETTHYIALEKAV
ncbi:PAS domain-containing protein, partial [Polaribacter sp.]|uniref:PAS domain-containing protein n=1 Tax=Polaribacter sp. TaxID=1920175 RepID=UPI003F6B6883